MNTLTDDQRAMIKDLSDLGLVKLQQVLLVNAIFLIGIHGLSILSNAL